MYRILLVLLLLVGIGILWVYPKNHAAGPTALSAAAPQPRPSLVAAPGLVEPISEEISVAAEVGGKLAAVHVRAGDALSAGQIIAELQNQAQKARVALSRAQVQLKNAALRRLLNGARPEERAEAQARVKQAEAVTRNARSEMERKNALVGRGFASAEETQRLERVYEVAKSDLDAAQQQYALVASPPREEDVESARAEIALAEAQLAEAEARLEMTLVRAPIAGSVLRVHKRVGETVSDARDTPILTMGDISRLRVRAEIDETDVGRIAVGQRAYVRADAFGAEQFWGTVVGVEPGLGRKRIRTDEPTERLDVKVLDVLIELDQGGRLLSGLRVDVFITPRDAPAS